MELVPTRRGWAGLVALLLCGASIAQEKTVATNGTPGAADSGGLATIVARMDEAAQRNRERYRPYVLIREFKLFSNDPQKPAAQVRAETSFVPPSKREFRILDQSGSSRGEGIVRRLLESESNAASSQSGTVSNDNYEFTLHGEASMNGRSCYLLELKARRKEQELVNGQACTASKERWRSCPRGGCALSTWRLHSSRSAECGCRPRPLRLPTLRWRDGGCLCGVPYLYKRTLGKRTPGKRTAGVGMVCVRRAWKPP
jgi:hypothetical protein